MDPSLIARPSRFERASAALHRVLWIAASVLRGLAILALVAAVTVTVAGLAWLIDVPPHDGSEWGARVVILAALLVPPALLLLFVAGLRDLQHLPERTRLPADVSARARDLRDRARKVDIQLTYRGTLRAPSYAAAVLGPQPGHAGFRDTS